MKKVLSLLLAVVMVIGMLPLGVITAGAAEVTETLSVFGSTGTLASDSSSISWTSGNVTFTNSKASSTTAIRTSDADHFRMYSGSAATVDCTGGNITKIVVTCTGSSYAEDLVSSVGAEASASGSVVTITPAAAAASYSIAKLSAQVRINAVEVTYATVDSSDCAHTNTAEIAAVEATCTTAGNTAGVKCTDCGTTISGNETIAALGHTETAETTAVTCTEDGYTTYTCSVCGNTRKSDWVDATGHSYVEGVCTVCGVEMPSGLDGKYYIAAIRSSGNYMYMTNDLGTASTSRYQIVDSGLTELPASIENTVDTQVFELIFDASTATYKIKTGDQYLGYTSGNSGTLVDETTALAVTIDSAANGAYNIHFTASDAERYLSLNSNADYAYYAWYKLGQVSDLYLVPVAADAEACTHANTTTTTVAATCTEAGSTTVTCDDCGETVSTTTIDATGHSYVDGTCSVCGAADPNAGTDENANIVFELGAAGTASHTDGSSATTYTETVGAYTLTLTDCVKMYTGAVDATGNGCIKLGTSSAVGGFTFTAPDDVTEVVISVAKYKANNTTVNVNGTEYVLTNNSNDGAYDEITVDTTTGKTVTITTVSGKARAMVNSITFICGSDSESDHTCVWDEGAVTTAATCTEDGIKTYSCTVDGCTETKTEVIKATGHSYTVAGNTATCSCGDSQTISTIAEAKAYTDTFAVYYLKGIVTYVKGTTVYIEDATGGICVYFNYGTALDLALGDEILVWDCMTTYNGLIETTNTTSQEYVKVSTGNALPSQTVTLAQLTADTTNEYLSERVVIENVTMGTINTSGATTLTDADGNTLSIYKVSGLAEEINEGDTVTVTAIVSTYNGYQLLVNPGTAAADVVETASGEETVVETVSIATAKAGTAGEYYQVEGVVTFIDGKNVYIQDSTGGIVVYLTASNTTAAIGDKVKAYGALKTYNGLIELDGIDQTNTEFFEVLSSGNTVEAQTVTVADLTADTINEYLAEKVTIENAYISAVGSWSSSYMNVNYTITSGDSSIVIYRAPAATAEDVLAVNSIVSLEAIVSTYNGYQLRVVDASKITATAAVCSVDGVPYASMKDALANYTAGSYVKMLADTDEEFTLTADLYIDLSGKTLSGTVDTAGYKIYGMDAATDNYSCDVMGYLACIDENGDDIVPEAMVQTSVTGEARRYLTIETGSGYTFHRFYLGLTYATVKPSTKGVGYKAVFAGDDMVKEKIDSFGYTLQLEGNDAVTCSKSGTEFVSLETVTLRVDNYDAEKYGQTGLSASVFMTIDGQTVSTSVYTSTLKAMVEKINELTLTDEQKTALAAWIAESEVMQTWNVGNIYTAE